MEGQKTSAFAKDWHAFAIHYLESRAWKMTANENPVHLSQLEPLVSQPFCFSWDKSRMSGICRVSGRKVPTNPLRAAAQVKHVR